MSDLKWNRKRCVKCNVDVGPFKRLLGEWYCRKCYLENNGIQDIFGAL